MEIISRTERFLLGLDPLDIRSKAAKGTVLDGLLKHWLRAQVMGRKYAKDSHEVN